MHYIVPLEIFSALLAICIFLFVAFWRDSRKSAHWSMMALCIALYIVGHVFSSTATDHSSAYRAVAIEYFGLPFIAPNALLAVVDFYNRDTRRFGRPLLFLLPLVFSALVISGNPGNIFYADTSYFPGPPAAHLGITPAPLYYVSVVYTLVLLLLTQIMIIVEMRKARTKGYAREIALILALALPTISNILYLSGNTPYGLDLTPIVLVITSALFALSIRKLNLLHLLPLTRETIFEKMTDGLIIVDARGRFLYANRAAKGIYPEMEALRIGSAMCASDFSDLLSARLDDAPIMRAEDGRYYHISKTDVTKNGKIMCRSILLFDVTEARKMMEVLRERASYDVLTKVYNRATILEMACAEFDSLARSGGQGAALMFDLDRYKSINDTYGHQCGDMVLVTAAERIRRKLRDIDIFGRYGGEEFLGFLKHIAPENAIELAKSLCAAIGNEPFSWQGKEFAVTVSIGIAMYDGKQHAALEDMIAQADAALYEAKESGRNRVVLYGGE